MSRTLISSNVPAEIAERISDTDKGYTAAEETAIEMRADEIMDEWLNDADKLADLLDGIPSRSFSYELTRLFYAFTRPTRSRYPKIDADAWRLFSAIKPYADKAWRDDAREQAEAELARGEIV